DHAPFVGAVAMQLIFGRSSSINLLATVFRDSSGMIRSNPCRPQPDPQHEQNAAPPAAGADRAPPGGCRRPPSRASVRTSVDPSRTGSMNGTLHTQQPARIGLRPAAAGAP